MVITKEDIGKFVKVKPVSNKGRNRVNEHGVIWKVRKVWGKKILLEGTMFDGTPRQSLRWVEDNDPDFVIEEFLGLIPEGEE